MKPVDAIQPVHPVHLEHRSTCSHPVSLPLGFLINSAALLLKNGLGQAVNDHKNFASSRLCVS